MSRRNKWLERNGIALAVIVSITVALVLIITVFWYSNDWTATGTVALACFGAIGIVFNYISTTELKRDRVPYVHVNFTSYEEKRHSIYVVVQNSGNAPAHDIEINVSSLEAEDKLLESGAIFSNLQNLSFIKHPIKFLPPNDSRRTLFGNVMAMRDYESEVEYEVNVSYKDSAGRKYNSYTVLDVTHLMGLKYTESNDPTVEALNDIKSELNRLANNIERIYGTKGVFNESNESDEYQSSRKIDEEDSEDI